jgi:outer membrane protein assembly factor BamB
MRPLLPALLGAALLGAPLLLGGCGIFSDAKKPRLTGERLSVLSLDRRLEPDPALQQLEVRLPRPLENAAWPQSGGYPNHAMHHLALGDAPQEVWRASVGTGAGRRSRITTPPVVFDGRVYAMDGEAQVRAFEAQTGRLLWEFDPKPEAERGETFGGGVAYAEEKLFVASGYGEVVALDAATGAELWRQRLPGPTHAAPTVADGRVFVVTIDNQLEVLAADDGRRLWNNTGTAESAGLLGGAAPAVEGDVVVVPYSSGDLLAFRVENGRPLWSDSLAATRRIDALSSLTDIRGRPVIDRGRVYAVSHSGRMSAVDLRTGARVWEQEIGGTDMPWVAGDFIYVLSNDAEIVCLTRRDGRVRWVFELPRWEDLEDKEGPLRWSGPVLAGDRLIAVASNGEALSLSPYTGEALGRIELPDGVYIAPIVADGTLYVLTDDAELIAMR